MTKEQGEQLLKEFEAMKDMAELKALSKHSLEHPLSDTQYHRIIELKKKVFAHMGITEE